MADNYQFQYLPLTGKLSGKSMIDQTERAINELAQIVNEGSAQVGIITDLANEASNSATEALEKANEALETSGRIYITESLAVNLDGYYDSQLIYIANNECTNLPVTSTGFLEVRTNDDKTMCEQTFMADGSGDVYTRSGVITASVVGETTVYTVTFDAWTAKFATEGYVQNELESYLPLSGGTLTGDVQGITPQLGDDSPSLATTEFVQNELGNRFPNYLPLSGGTMTGDILWENEDNDVFGIGFSDTNKDNVDIGWIYNDKIGAGIGLRNVSHNDGGAFNLWATDGVNIKTLVGKADGSMNWAGNDVATIISLGNAPNNTTTSFTLPASGTYLLFTGHNSTPGVCGMWMIRTGGNSAFNFAGGSNVTVTCSSTTITVKPTAGQANVWAVKFPAS